MKGIYSDDKWLAWILVLMGIVCGIEHRWDGACLAAIAAFCIWQELPDW